VKKIGRGFKGEHANLSIISESTNNCEGQGNLTTIGGANEICSLE
jgi:hypothetical protein